MNGTATREIFKLLSRPEIISFAGGLPASECLLTEKLARFAAEALSGADAKRALQYGTTEGFADLRRELINYLDAAGIGNQTPENVLVVSGGQQGIDLVLKSFIDKGDSVLVENPTYLAFLQILNSYEGIARGVDATDDGLDLDDLEKKIRLYGPKILYCVPTFSNPTGKTYSAANRRGLIEICARHGVIILEDDPYGRLRFKGEHIPPLKSFDASDTVVYVSSFSKIMSPGLRVAVAAGPKEIIRKMAIGKQGTDLHTSNLSQLITLKYLQSGELAADIQKSLPIYKLRKDAMMSAIDRYMPEEFIHTDPDGGLFVWGRFNAPLNVKELLPEAVEQNAVYISGGVFYADPALGRSAIRLNYSNESPERIERGIAALGNLFKKKIAEAKRNG
jgi:2-aminoadipate transaminase